MDALDGLATGFDPPSMDDWRRDVASVLDRRGTLTEQQLEARWQRVLVSDLHDGVRIQPLVTRDDLPDAAAAVGLPGSTPFVRGSTAQGPTVAGWDVRQPLLLDPDDTSATAAAALAELTDGVTSLFLRLPAGVDAADVDAACLGEMLEGVLLDVAGVALEDPGLAEAFLAVAARADEPGPVTGTLGLDPVGARLTGADHDTDGAVTAALELSRRAVSAHPLLRPFALDGVPVAAAGGSDADELAVVVANGIETLRRLDALGLAPGDALPWLSFRLAATPDQFSTIAKLRAARRLWARVGAELGVTDDRAAMHQHAVLSPAVLTRHDPWVNVLRGTVAAMAAGVGGAAAVTIEAYDELHGTGRASARGRRLARNTQAMLLDESSLGAVIDPAGGAYAVEVLTDDLATAAWGLVQDLEAVGGLTAAIGSGMVRERMDATWSDRVDAIARRHDAITGVSEFPLLDEDVPLPVLPDLPDESALDPTVLPRRRHAAVWEELRARSRRHADATGAEPVVVLAEIGSLAESTARAQFAANLFAAGGIRSVAWRVDDGADALAALLSEHHDPVLGCVCSTDDRYAAEGADVVAALREAGIGRIHVAGNHVPLGSSAGNDDATADVYVHLGGDVLSVLRDALDAAGVA